MATTVGEFVRQVTQEVLPKSSASLQQLKTANDVKMWRKAHIDELQKLQVQGEEAEEMPHRPQAGSEEIKEDSGAARAIIEAWNEL